MTDVANEWEAAATESTPEPETGVGEREADDRLVDRFRRKGCT